MKLLKSTFILSVILALGTTAKAQTDLLVGHRGNGTTSQDSLIYADTTGGVFSIIESRLLTTDFGGAVLGLYGMALHPFTNDMYVVYGRDSDAETRRLGILDPSDASIADIGLVGSIIELTFIDTTLYASSGTYDGVLFGRVNKYTAEFTSLYNHANGFGGSAAINFDYYQNRILRSCQGSSTYEVIDPITLTETSVAHSGHPGWTTSLLTINENTALSIGNTTVNTLNTNTFTYSSIGTVPSSNYLQSSSFVNYPVSLWVNGSREFCAVGSKELKVVGAGTSFVWYKDGVVIPSESASTYTATTDGEYTVEVDGEMTNPVIIDIRESMNPDFDASENPAYIGAAPSVDVTFTNTTPAGDYSFAWDSGAGEVSTDENPTFAYTAIGTYSVTLVITDNVTGCEETIVQDLIVAGGVGINESKIDFEIYPNPASTHIKINADLISDEFAVIYNALGAEVARHNLTSTNNVIDISDLQNGNYVLKIGATEQRFVKQ
jgi:hypothetical protein